MEGSAEPALQGLVRPEHSGTQRAEPHRDGLAAVPVWAWAGGGRRPGRPHRLGHGAVGSADGELRASSLSLSSLAAPISVGRGNLPDRYRSARSARGASGAATRRPASPEISIRFHCAGGCDPPTAWPAADTPTTGTRFFPVPPIQFSDGSCEWPCSTSSAPCLRTVFWKLPMPNSRLCCGHCAAHRRMMDHDDPEQALLARLVEQPRQTMRLDLAEEAAGHEGRGRARARNADQRDLARAPAYRESCCDPPAR